MLLLAAVDIQILSWTVIRDYPWFTAGRKHLSLSAKPLFQRLDFFRTKPYGIFRGLYFSGTNSFTPYSLFISSVFLLKIRFLAFAYSSSIPPLVYHRVAGQSIFYKTGSIFCFIHRLTTSP
jgi:hypothetical protein